MGRVKVLANYIQHIPVLDAQRLGTRYLIILDVQYFIRDGTVLVIFH